MTKYDIILIGSGQATGTIVPKLVAQGLTVAIAEGGRFGGTCVNYGCSPTKTIVASARAAHMARRGADFGVVTGDIEIDFSKVVERQSEIRNGWSNGLKSWLSGLDGVTIYNGYAQFESATTVRINDDVIEGDKILIHTGARPRVIDLPGLDTVDYLTNRELLELTELPEKMIIIGGSYIGMEFAQAFRRFGTEITILEAGSQLMFREDADIAQSAREILEKEGIEVICNAKVLSVAKGENAAIEVFIEKDGVEQSVTGSHLLLGVGRIPNSDNLNLKAAGVETNGRGYITVNDQLQTNIPNIYALGDVNGHGSFTHTSVNDGEIFLDNLNGGNRKVSDRLTTYAMYIDPPLGRVGINENDARQSDRNVLMATRPMKNISRAIEKDEKDGLVKILVDADTEEILGAAILGVGGDEIINMFTTVMHLGGSYKDFRKIVLNHPTVSELMPWILDDLKPLE